MNSIDWSVLGEESALLADAISSSCSMWLGLLEQENSSIRCTFCNTPIPWIICRKYTCSHCHAQYCSKEHKRADQRYHRHRCNKQPQEVPYTDSPESSMASLLGTHPGSIFQGDFSTIPHIECLADLQGGLDKPVDLTTKSVSSDTHSKRGSRSSTSSNAQEETEMHVTPMYDASPLSPAEVPSPCSLQGVDNSAVLNLANAKLTVNEIAAFTADSLQRNNYCILDNFNGSTLAQCIYEEVKGLYFRGELSDGKLSTCEVTEVGPNGRAVREDKVAWLRGVEAKAVQRHMLHMDKFMSHCNKYFHGLEISKSRTHAMVACYPGGGTGYKPHVDNPIRDGRCITTLYYVNPEWNARRDGGILTLFPNSRSRSAVHVEPVMDRMLLFWSDHRTPHTVNPTFKTRFAITLWYFDQKERESYFRRILMQEQLKHRS
ncbi:egl nine homolog 1 isoform X2 [Nematostella vectensis]|uniref:egl nine homolog 1 isoform X2 n=1 Tax=Nematostella vectensis TaxID=45351 RepID=UPI00139025E5|nr:egl nine homolog 1 isoform X2 [Nematostella vectensis]